MGNMLPLDTWMASAPCRPCHCNIFVSSLAFDRVLRPLQTWMESSIVLPGFSQGNTALLVHAADLD
jgi:hypothetical protein